MYRSVAYRCFQRRQHQEVGNVTKREYSSPELEEFGSVADLTQVGQTKPGDDVLPGTARGKDSGSINPDGLE